MRPRTNPFPLPPPWLLFALLLAAIFVIHSGVMLLERGPLRWLGEPLGSIAEAVILTAALAPFVWWFVVRPLRSAAASERLRAGDALRSIVLGTAATTDDEFFRSLVRHLASALQVRYAFVGELEATPPERIRTIAVWSGDGFGENIEYLLDGTPCQNVVGQSLCCYPDHVQERFPKDRLLVEMQVESYLGTPLFDASGAPLGLLVVMNDKPVREEELARSIVSVFAARAGAELERRRADRARAAAERQFRALVEHSLVGTYVIQDGRIRYASPRLAEMLGYRQEELESQTSMYDLIAEEDRELVAGRVRERIEGDATSAHYTFRARRSDGTLICLEVHGARTELDGKPAIIGTALDITERRRTEEALRRSEASLREFVENAAFGIYRSTADGRLTMVNQALVRTLGYDSAEELLAVDMATGLYRDPEERARLIAQYRSYERFDGIEVQWKRRDGSPIAVRLSGRTVRDVGGELQGFEVIVEDVRERHALEQQLRQAQKMEAVGQLAGGMAHDFNNLLTTILATTELMSAELPADSPLRADIQAIREAGLHGAALTSKLLGFSRRKELQFQVLNLGELLGDFTRLVRRLVPENIEIKMVLGPAGTAVRADAGAVEQILMNLVTNARDAMPAGGTLVIETTRAVLDEEFGERHGWGAPGDYVVLTVSDTGVGMDADAQRRVFEPFFTTKPVGTGTGLGMAMVYGLVKQHMGYVHVYSEPGRGTTVKVYFPTEHGAAGSRTTQETLVVRGGSERILLVEDEAALRRAAERALRKHGYTVLVAADGQEALELARRENGAIDLIVTDVVMPKLGGPELIEALRREGIEVRVLLTSGYTARDAQLAADFRSDMPFLAKPWTIAELLTAVRSALDKGHRRGTAGARRVTPPGATPRPR